MKHVLAYESFPTGPKPDAKLGKPLIVSCAVAIVGLALSCSGGLPWLMGRVNAGGLATALLFSLAAFALWVAVLIWLLVRVASSLSVTRPSMRQLSIMLALLMCLCLPWVGLRWRQDPTFRFQDGFAVWAANSVDIKSIRQWPIAGPANGPAMSRSQFLWMYGANTGASSVPRSAWPPDVAHLNPTEVNILKDNAVILVWLGNGEWLRFLYIGEPGSQPPEDLRRLDTPILWRTVESGVEVGVAYPH